MKGEHVFVWAIPVRHSISQRRIAQTNCPPASVWACRGKASCEDGSAAKTIWVSTVRWRISVNDTIDYAIADNQIIFFLENFSFMFLNDIYSSDCFDSIEAHYDFACNF